MEILAAFVYGIAFLFGGENALYIAVAISIVLVVLLVYFIKMMAKSKFLNELVLFKRSTKDEGYTSAEGREYLIGKRGKVIGELRPAGAVFIDNNPVDVVSEGAYIKKGELVEVVAVNGNRVVVRKVDEF
ncbi:MAG: hypothetical protein J6O04_08610 [Selenomonadaceae bacterium]|nr:hypothetical protein [Selenomonadaceae bacterium]